MRDIYEQSVKLCKHLRIEITGQDFDEVSKALIEAKERGLAAGKASVGVEKEKRALVDNPEKKSAQDVAIEALQAWPPFKALGDLDRDSLVFAVSVKLREVMGVEKK